jgi:type I restriction enzyme M protein
MEYRHHGYYSFRGHRNRNWKLGIRFKLENLTEAQITRDFLNFKTRCLALPKADHIPEWNDWRWLFLAQHYGLRTNLLDWSSNPLVALYFAVENVISRANDESNPGCVWGLRVNETCFKSTHDLGSPIDPENQRRWNQWFMVNAPPITRRLEAQSGKFSYHPSPTQLITDPEDDEARHRELVLFCVVGSDGKNVSSELREDLGIMNIHHASMFPDHQGIAAFINYESKSLQPH